MERIMDAKAGLSMRVVGEVDPAVAVFLIEPSSDGRSKRRCDLGARFPVGDALRPEDAVVNWFRALAGPNGDPAFVPAIAEAVPVLAERAVLRGLLAAEGEDLAARLDEVAVVELLARYFPAWTPPHLVTAIRSAEELARWLALVRARWEARLGFSATGFVTQATILEFERRAPWSAERVLLRRALHAEAHELWQAGAGGALGTRNSEGGAAAARGSAAAGANAEAGEGSSKWGQGVAASTELGVEHSAARAALGSAIEEAEAGTNEARDRARSAAERWLAGLLEGDPRTRGQFALNTSIDVHWQSGRAFEIDLACRSRRFAIEIDGPHHFRSLEDWRRDRAKDLGLQRSGWIVMRILPEDLAQDPRGLVERIVEVFNERHAVS